MGWLKYLLLLPLFVAMRLATYPLAPVAVAFRRGFQLRRPFLWMMTDDNDLLGDEGWVHAHCDGDSETYCCMVRWLWRNGGHHAAYHLFGCPAGRGPVFRRFHRIGAYLVEIYLGWGGARAGRSKYVLTVRIRHA